MDKVPPPKPKRSPGVYTRPTASPHIFMYDSLPTAPPDLCANRDENFFQFPAVMRRLSDNIVDVASKSSNTSEAEACTQSIDNKNHCCLYCQPYREDRETIEPLKNRLKTAIEAMDQLNRTYALLDTFLEQKLSTILDNDAGDDEQMVVDEQKPDQKVQRAVQTKSKMPLTGTEFELEHSLSFLESLFGTEIVPTFKQGAFKRMRERSKSMMEDEIHLLNKERNTKFNASRSYLLRRQSTYSDNKSKVSKWTKVKAAFKWERANVPPANDNDTIGLTPVNHEVARYLKVPSNPCAGSSSADSIISSSSGHFMSDTGGTPGTISSASSLDDIDASCRHTMRYDSSKSDTRCDSRISDFEGAATVAAGVQLSKSATDERLDCTNHAVPSKSSSNKSLRRSKVFSDFEALPEDHVADIKATSSRRNKLPPSPLNLMQDSNDQTNFYTPFSLKSPKDGTQSLGRMKRINSPGNSSVPSSPSRHSDFFNEFESEDISSGDFSEPTTPNQKNFNQKQDEVLKSYRLLLKKLDREFKTKHSDFANVNRAASAVALRSGIKSDEHSPTQVYNDFMSTEQLEENLTPEFKKKLHKWRIKKQNSLMAAANAAYNQAQQSPQQLGTDSSTSPTTTKNQQANEAVKPKFDWNLWSMGQVKLEGQGLCALPEQKDLTEEFQKKLEQWNKIKSGGAVSDNDSLKRSSQKSQSSRRGSDDDRWYKHKSHDKEKLAKLKAIVAPDHQTKNIEVQTASGVMKFEGISRKFTRKLYEWEQARGIGPEASTFALLHPGYCPIDVRRINKDNHKSGTENSPTLSRSLSLDSITPSVTLPVISQQASSLSLDNVNEFKNTGDSTDALTDHVFKKDDELEAVMVEVEEHIDDTASPLVTAHTLVEQQTPIYKYEELQCNDYCNTRRVQSYESHTNLGPMLSALKRADELFEQLKKASPDIVENVEMRNCQTALLSIRNIYPYYSNNLMKANVLNAVSDVQNELGRLTELSHKSPLDEACCQEIMEERNNEYDEEFRGLYEALDCLKQNIQGGMQRFPKDIVPDINITNTDGQESSVFAPCDYTLDFTCRSAQLSPTNEVNDELSGSHMENETESTIVTTATYRTVSNAANGNGGGTGVVGSKKKLRLRKIGSRQNSKTESESSDAETQSVLETPRRLRRQKFRLKQRSLDDDFRLRADEPLNSTLAATTTQTNSEDVLYTLKVKPGAPIEQSQLVGSANNKCTNEPPTKPLPGECTVKAFVPPPLPELHTLSYNTNANVFVKTKRKLFTTIIEPNATEGIAVIEKILDSPTLTDDNTLEDVAEREDVAANNSTPNKEHEISTIQSPKPKLFIHKSISLEDLTTTPGSSAADELRKAQSTEHMQHLLKHQEVVRVPLASDSFRLLNRQLINKELVTAAAASREPRKEHLYKKNLLMKSHTTNNAKIEHKIAKTQSAVMEHGAAKQQPNRMDNTLPRIQRKLGEIKTPLTPTVPKQFEFPTKAVPPDEMTAQNNNNNNIIQLLNVVEKPVTPISERALRLQRAKAEFLQCRASVSMPQTPTSPPHSFNMPVVSNENLLNNQLWEAAYPPDTPTLSEKQMHKSSSTATFNTEANAAHQSDQETVSQYEHGASAVTRSGKISSKLGFATLASKLRRVKVGSKKRKDSGGGSGSASGNSALSALCRQTLMADVVALPQLIGANHRISTAATTTGTSAASGSGVVLKSQSSPHASSAHMNNTINHDALNKSQSEQFVKYLVCKESDV